MEEVQGVKPVEGVDPCGRTGTCGLASASERKARLRT